MGIVYILENKIDGKCYVGQTTRTFEERLSYHRRAQYPIGNALRKYGIDNFNIIKIENVLEEQLDDVECENIIKYNSVRPNGYNLETGGNKNKHLSEETKQKISKSRSGISFSEEHKRKISEGIKGHIVTEETRKKIKIANKGKSNYWLGRKHSEETKAKLSKIRKGIPNTWQKGIPRSEETKRKIGEANRKHPGS